NLITATYQIVSSQAQSKGNGQHTAQTFADGLKDGSMGIDSVYIYFQQKLKGVTQVDLNQEGRQTIATLKTGLQT
ncbi:hypothetical protein ACT453_54215, partial [Bacillus sp. D-CC]